MLAIVGTMLAVSALSTSAATDTMNATDNGGQTSFNTGLHWTSGVAPAPGTDYFTAGFALRTPTSGAEVTFLGNSLTINTNASALGKLQSKMPADAVITVTNLIMAGGMVNYANASDNFINTLAGSITISNIPGNVTNYFVMGGSTTAGTGGEMLDVTATISGSGKVQVGATSASSTEYYMAVAGGTPSQWQGALKLSADNPYGGTMKVVGNPAHTVRGGLQLNHTNALKNATLVLATTTVNPLSFEAGVNASPFNIGALAGTISEALTDTAGSPVTISVGGNNASTIYSGALTGGGSLVKTGTGTLTLAGTNTYSGATVVKNGTLALSGGAVLTNTSITIASGATFDVSAASAPFVMESSQVLYGSGTVTGSVTTVSGSKIYAGLDGFYGTNAFKNSLTNASGSQVCMDLGELSAGPNDRITVGGNLALNNTIFRIKAPSAAVNMDTTDYILMTVSGTITGTPASAPTWDVEPLNGAHYTVIKSGNNIVLHYNASLVPQGYGWVSPNPAARNQPVLVTVAITFNANPISSVTADATALGASSSVPLFSDGSGNYTNSVVIAPGIAAGTHSLIATITDSASVSGSTAPFTVDVAVGSQTWSGGGANNNWSSSLNWQSGFAPGYVGDAVTFAGTTRLTPNMEANYTVTSLTFDGSAGSFVLNSIGGNTLSLAGNSIANYSANTQTINFPIAASESGIDFSGGNIVVNGGIAGVGGLQNDSSGSVTLNGTNTFAGGILINSGMLQMAGAGLLGGTNGNYSGNITNYSELRYSSSATQTLSGVISENGQLTKDGSGTLTLTANNTYSGNTIINSGVLQVAGTLGVGNYSGSITDNGTLRWSSASAQTLSGDISGTGGLLKDGAGTLTLNAANTYGGATIVSAGTLVYNANTISYPTIGSLSIGSNATVAVNANSSASLPVGSLTLNSNSTLHLSYDFSGGNPTVAAVDVQTSLSLLGTNTIRISGYGAVVGQFPLISYVGTPLANLNNLKLVSPPGVTASLVNNTANHTVDLNVTAVAVTTWIPLNATDTAGTTSFDVAGHWSDGNPPTAGNGYYTKSFMLRTPANANSYTFAGSVLSIDAYTFAGNVGGRFLMKGPGGATITVPNLILNDALVDYANANFDNGVETLAGNITLNGGTSYMGALISETLRVTAPIGGPGSLQIGGANINSGTDVGVVALEGNNTYSGGTTVATGTLLVNGSAANTAVTVFSNATLGGIGSIGGTVSVQTGGKLAPGILALGALTNALGTLTAGGAVSVSGTVLMKIDRAASPASDKLAAPVVTINPGATLTVTNIGSTNLVAGDTFTLFSTPVSGSFSVTNLPSLPSSSLFWTNKLSVNGTIAVASTVVGPTGPGYLTNSFSGGVLSFTWPAGQGWRLQMQTNSLSSGLGTNWVYVTDGAISSTNITASPTNGSVFFRLVYP
jgi:autotransporter-associated beta strand protein